MRRACCSGARDCSTCSIDFLLRVSCGAPLKATVLTRQRAFDVRTWASLRLEPRLEGVEGVTASGRGVGSSNRKEVNRIAH